MSCVSAMACVMPQRYSILTIIGVIRENCGELLVLPDIFKYVTISLTCTASLVADKGCLLLRLL